MASTRRIFAALPALSRFSEVCVRRWACGGGTRRMTCAIGDDAGERFRFMAGADGEYALAAKQLEAPLKNGGS